MTSSTSKKMGWGRKGQLTAINDFATLIIVPFILAIVFIVVALTFSDISDNWSNVTTNQQSRDFMTDNQAKFVPIIDAGFAIIFVGLIIAGVVGLFLIDTHPVLFLMAAIGFFALFIVGGMLANSFSDVTETGRLSTFSSDFTFLPLLMENLLIAGIVVSGVFGVAFFAKIQLG